MWHTISIEKKKNMSVSSYPGSEHREKYNHSKVRFINVVSFILSFFDAFWLYVASSYLSRVVHSDNVGAFYLIAFVLLLVGLFSLQSVVRRVGKVRTLALTVGLSILMSALLTHLSSWMGAATLILLILVSNLTWTILDIILEGFSSDHLSGRIRGLHLTMLNVAYLVAPILAFATFSQYGFEGVASVAVIGYSLALISVLLMFRRDNMVANETIVLKDTFAKMMRDKNLFHIYNISFALDFFYAVMIVYMPLYLHNLGYGLSQTGIIFTVMLIPFVILQYPLGVIADTKFGEKEILIGSLILIGLSSVVVAMLGVASLLSWAVVLFVTRVGAASVEVLRDSYFYKHIDGNDADVIAFFRTSRPVGNVAAALIATGLLLYFPIPAMFWAVAVVAFAALFSAMYLTDSESEAERKRVSDAG